MQSSARRIALLGFLVTAWPGETANAQNQASWGKLIVIVPVEASIYINDHPTRSIGAERHYWSGKILPGNVYVYRVRAELQRDGQLLEETKTIELQAGQTKRLAFDFPNPPEPEPPDSQRRQRVRRPIETSDAPVDDLDDEKVAMASPTLPVAPPFVETYLANGRLAEGEEELMTLLRKTPQDNELRFSLATVQFLRAVEGLMQGFYRHGLKYDAAMTPFGRPSIPFLRLPVPHNPAPEPISYDDARDIMQTFIRDLWKAESSLAAMDGTEVQLVLDFGQMRIDSNGDGMAAEDELLWKIFARVNPQMRISNTTKASLLIAFDRADAYWLRGYCHLLMAMAEVVLAHDGKELFERSAFLFFPKPVSPHTFLMHNSRQSRDMQTFYMVDLVATVHSVNLPVAEPERMAAALTHLEVVVDESRKTWKAIQAEKDNDREWIPGPNQTGAIPNMRVTQNIVHRWHQFLDELDGLLDGKKLVPFWRSGVEGQGINVRRIFTEPTRLDLVAWVQGSAATPYLEPGELTDRSVWQRLQDAFGGQMMTFIVWFN